VTEGPLKDRRVLIVEDDYLMAEELRAEFERAGASVVGPAGRVSDALSLIEKNLPIQGAVLDINLAGEMAFDVADLLRTNNVPFVFVTGYDAEIIPATYATVARYEKPIDFASIRIALFGS